MPKLTIEDLKKIKEKASHSVALRTGDASVTITVHMGECGIDAGAREVMKTILEAKTTADRADIKVLAGPCIENCSQAPIVTVEFKDGTTTVYEKMDVPRMEQVFSGHILGGEVQTDFILKEAQKA